jgi:hypothetical protein
MSLSRLNHGQPGVQAHPEIVQGTTDFHHEIADALLPQADPVFDDAAALDAAVDMLSAMTLVQGPGWPDCCSGVSSWPRGFLVGMGISTWGSVNAAQNLGASHVTGVDCDGQVVLLPLEHFPAMVN